MNWIDELFGTGDNIFTETRHFFDVLTNPRTWFRAFMILFGLVIMIAALRY